MPSESYGIIVEGIYDIPVYRELIQKICGWPVTVFQLETGGASELMRTFPGLLYAFEHMRAGNPVSRAMIIRDSGAALPATVEAKMAAKIAGRTYAIPDGIRLHATRTMLETWLLADINAINTVVLQRGGRRVGAVDGPLEDIVDAKHVLRTVLTAAKVTYAPAVAQEIAQNTDLEVLKRRCPNFAAFEAKVI